LAAAGISRRRRAGAGGALRRESVRLHGALRRRESRRRSDHRAARGARAPRRHGGIARSAHPRAGARGVRRGATRPRHAEVAGGWAARGVRRLVFAFLLTQFLQVPSCLEFGHVVVAEDTADKWEEEEGERDDCQPTIGLLMPFLLPLELRLRNDFREIA